MFVNYPEKNHGVALTPSTGENNMHLFKDLLKSQGLVALNTWEDAGHTHQHGMYATFECMRRTIQTCSTFIQCFFCPTEPDTPCPHLRHHQKDTHGISQRPYCQSLQFCTKDPMPTSTTAGYQPMAAAPRSSSRSDQRQAARDHTCS